MIDRSRAAAYFLKACDGGEAGGCTSAGWLVDNGVGVPADKKRAVTLYLKACDGGEAKGCFFAGLAFFSGEGVSMDQARATQLFLKACSGQFAEGCFGAGAQFDDGLGVPQDTERAVTLFQKACDGGSMRGCNNIAVMLARGEGLPVDQNRATELYLKACDGGCAASCRTANARLERTDASMAQEALVKWHDLARDDYAKDFCKPFFNRQVVSRDTEAKANGNAGNVLGAIAVGWLGLAVWGGLTCGDSCSSSGASGPYEPHWPPCDHFECSGMLNEICYPASYATGMSCSP